MTWVVKSNGHRSVQGQLPARFFQPVRKSTDVRDNFEIKARDELGVNFPENLGGVRSKSNNPVHSCILELADNLFGVLSQPVEITILIEQGARIKLPVHIGKIYVQLLQRKGGFPDYIFIQLLVGPGHLAIYLCQVYTELACDSLHPFICREEAVLELGHLQDADHG